MTTAAHWGPGPWILLVPQEYRDRRQVLDRKE